MNTMEDDLAGRIIQNEKNVTVINLPCEAEDNDLLGRTKGQALFPEIGKDDKWLQEFKQGYQTLEGSRAWLALFQGRPSAEEGNIIKRGWFRYYNELPKMVYSLISVDATFKDGDNSDYVAIQVWGKRNKDFYLIDRIKDRMDFPTTLQAIRNTKAKYQSTNAILIEDKANGSAIISMLQRELNGVIAINPEGGKVARVNAISPLLESGNVYLPQKEWVNDFIEECVSFPNGKHDDDVDSMSQALNRLRTVNAQVIDLTPDEIEEQRRRQEQLRRYATGKATKSFINYGG